MYSMMKKLVKLLYNKGQIVNWDSSSMIKESIKCSESIYGPTSPPPPPPHVFMAYAGTLPPPVLPGTLQKLIKK
jgi:hypothetical protein